MDTPIICFEGPSGIGKTTMCQQLSKAFNIVPEVNLLFERPDNEPAYWYLDRQVERYDICNKSVKASILDGDVFQPIWYNWVCGYPKAFLPKAATHEFYKTKLSKGVIRFPDLYIIFQAEVEELRRRKAQDLTRQRRNFEKHLKIIEPLKKYYQFLDQETDLTIRFIDYSDFETAQEEVLVSIKAIKEQAINQLETFHQIEDWLNAYVSNVP